MKALEVYPNGEPAKTFKHDCQGSTFDKLTDVYNSGTRHEEKQPRHLKVDTSQCQR